MGCRPFLALVVLGVGGCSLGALSGFSGGDDDAEPGGSAPVDGGSSTQVLTDTDATAGVDGDAGDPGAEGGPPVVAPSCATPDALCSGFEAEPVSAGFDSFTGSGTSAIVKAGGFKGGGVQFEFVGGAGGSGLLGPRLTGSMGDWATVSCEVWIAFGSPPIGNPVDIFGFETDTAGVHEEAALRLRDDSVSLISCRNSSDCRSEVEGPAPPLDGGWHRYQFAWTREGKFSAKIDSLPALETATKTPIEGGTNLTINFGAFYRPFGSAGLTIRFDELACFRTRS